MSQKIIKIGSSLGVTLRGELLEELGIHQGDSVRVAINPQSQKIEIASLKQEEQALYIAEAKRLAAQYKDELSKLSEE